MSEQRLALFQTEEGKELAARRGEKAREFYASQAGIDSRAKRSSAMITEWQQAEHPHTIARRTGIKRVTTSLEFTEKQRRAAQILWSSSRGDELKDEARQRGLERYSDPQERVRTSRDVRNGQLHIIEETERRLIAATSHVWRDLIYEPGLPLGQQGRASAVCVVCDNRVERKILDWILQRGCRHCGCYVSKPQLEIAEYVRSLSFDVTVSDRSVLKRNREIDIWVPSKRLAIEYDGLYWHCELNCDVKPEIKRKMLELEGHAFFHIFADEWDNKSNIVKSRIKHRLGLSSVRLQARKCRLVELPLVTANEFFDENHIDGGVRSCEFAYGLVDHHDTLVSAVSTRKPLHKSEGTLEIARAASKLDHAIAGGLARLISAIRSRAKIEGYKKLMTYVDLRTSDGHGYKTCGFDRVSLTQPRFWWTDFRRRHDRFWCRASPSKSQAEVAHERGVYRIWGCANAVYKLIL